MIATQITLLHTTIRNKCDWQLLRIRDGHHSGENKPNIMKGQLPKTYNLHDICSACSIFNADKAN